MKRLVTVAVVVLGLLLGTTELVSARGGGSSNSGAHAHHVRQYTDKNGRVVPAHRQTNPDETQRNNWSSKPNVNPDTGKPGTITPTH
jgi:hypothetical protein